MKKIILIIIIITLLIGCSVNKIINESENNKSINITSSFIGIPAGSNYESMVNYMNIVFPFIEQVWVMGHPNKLFHYVDIGEFIVTKEVIDDMSGLPTLIEGISNSGDTYRIELKKNRIGNSNRAEFILYVNGEREYGIMEILKKVHKGVFIRSVIKYYPNEDYNVKIDVDFPEPVDVQYIGKQFEVKVEVFGRTFKETVWPGKAHSYLIDSLTMFLNDLDIEPVDLHMSFAQTIDPYLAQGVATWGNLAIQIPDSVVVQDVEPEILNTIGSILADFWSIWTTGAYYLVSKLVGG